MKLQEKLRKRFCREIYLLSEGGEHNKQDAELFDQETIKNVHAERAARRQKQWAANKRRSTHSSGTDAATQFLPTATDGTSCLGS